MISLRNSEKLNSVINDRKIFSWRVESSVFDKYHAFPTWRL